MFDFEKVIIEKNMYYKNYLILKYFIEYPRIISNSSYYVKQFNHFNQMKAIELKLYAEKELFENAKEIYDYNINNNLSFSPYELRYSYTSTYNKNKIVSLFFDQYIYASGAHGSTTRTSQTWNLYNGSQLSLCSLLHNDCVYFLLMLKEILHQIQTNIDDNTNIYFENYSNLIIEHFNFDQFYLIDNNIAIYYQHYDIAPYSSGIPVFYIHL